MKALILAGGFGTRLAHIAADNPKPLVSVAGKPLLQRQIEFLHTYGITEIRLSLHHKAEKIQAFCEERWPEQIEFVVEPRPLGTGGGVKFATQDWTEPFLAFNADDLLAGVDISPLLASRSTTVLCTKLEDARGYGLVTISDNMIREFLEKPKEKIAGYVNCGWYVLEPEALKEAGDRQAFMLEYDIFPALAGQGRLKAHVHDGYWVGVGTDETYHKANSDLPFVSQL